MRRYDSNLENAVPEARLNAAYAKVYFPRRTSLFHVKHARRQGADRDQSTGQYCDFLGLPTRIHAVARTALPFSARCSSWNVVSFGFFPLGSFAENVAR